jgi:hypothetical protein
MQGVDIICNRSTYSSDLQKAIQVVDRAESEMSLKYELVIFGGLSGRLDQSVHTLNVLWQLAPNIPWKLKEFPSAEDGGPEPDDGVFRKRPNVYVVSDGGVTCIIGPVRWARVHSLTQGEQVIQHDRSFLGKTCGILPLGTGPAHVYTEGLEWNLGTCLCLSTDTRWMCYGNGRSCVYL